MQKSPQQTYRAFTLVELLVVIAIISILAALLLPSIDHAMEQTRDVSCKNRMRQLMVVSHEYEAIFTVIVPPYLGYYQWGTLQDGPTLLWDAGLLDSSLVTIAENWTAVSQYPKYTPISRELSFRAASIYMCPSGKYDGRVGYFFRNGNYYEGIYSNPASAPDSWNRSRDGVCQWNDGVSVPYQGSYPAWNPAPDRTGILLYCTPISYTLNANFCVNVGGSGFDAVWKPIRSYSGDPSRKLFYIESANMYAGEMAPVDKQLWDWNNTQAWAAFRYFRSPHVTNANYACHDGHVGTVLGTPWGAFQPESRDVFDF